METPFLTRAESRAIDEWAIQSLGIPCIVLMENAGRGVVDALLECDPEVRSVCILCGKGNNGGDGFVIARHLAIRGAKVRVALVAPPAELTGDALTNYQILTRSGLAVADLSQVDDLPHLLDAWAGDAEWLVDALLGTGARGEPREPYRTAIAWMNGKPCRRLAVDLPSGLDCDTGTAAAATVRADLTCTFVARKAGFAHPAAQESLGEVRVVGIGITSDLFHESRLR
jgi:NAD(P)H-hydrate epimerase